LNQRTVNPLLNFNFIFFIDFKVNGSTIYFRKLRSYFIANNTVGLIYLLLISPLHNKIPDFFLHHRESNFMINYNLFIKNHNIIIAIL